MEIKSVNACRDQSWKRGLHRITPGIYADDAGAMHIDAGELLVSAGYAPSEHNIDTLEIAIKQWAAEAEQLEHREVH